MHTIKTFGAAVLMVAACATPGIIKADVASSVAVAVATPGALTLAPVALRMRVTAYSSTPDQTDDTPFVTASGMSVGDGIIASNIFPFGTKVQIPALFGDKIFVVEDRMALRIKNTIDIWMPTREKALWFGVHVADIVIVPLIPPTIHFASAAITPSPIGQLALR